MEKPIFKFAVREDLKDVESTFIPKRAEEFATGWDVKAAFNDRKSIKLYPTEKAKIPLGFRAFCPAGWWYEVKPRSSSFAKKSLHCLYGTIDETYENELVFACQYIPQMINYYNNTFDITDHLIINFGDAIGQIIPVKRKEIVVESVSNEELDKLFENRKQQLNTTRGIGGFGSTGDK
jgi:dUTPase